MGEPRTGSGSPTGAPPSVPRDGLHVAVLGLESDGGGYGDRLLCAIEACRVFATTARKYLDSQRPPSRVVSHGVTLPAHSAQGGSRDRGRRGSAACRPGPARSRPAVEAHRPQSKRGAASSAGGSLAQPRTSLPFIVTLGLKTSCTARVGQASHEAKTARTSCASPVTARWTACAAALLADHSRSSPSCDCLL